MDSDEVLISVVIPVFNEELTVGNVIQRVTEVMQKLGFDCEIIVVDDCSTDKAHGKRLRLKSGLRKG
jgi:glycosyltransferase involved in cell wall biosynthesis